MGHITHIYSRENDQIVHAELTSKGFSFVMGTPQKEFQPLKKCSGDLSEERLTDTDKVLRKFLRLLEIQYY